MDRATLFAVAAMLLAWAGSAQQVSAAGHAPSQASGPLGVTALAGKYTGGGVTIGVISDSFSNPNCDTGIGQCATTAAQDIASGNLPGPGNPNGDTTPVVVIQDGHFKGQQDMGRAMLQIIYGLAPKARLCFATAGASQASFADAITSLASATGPCKANVIVDDGFVGDEGSFFSDGMAAAAINQAVAAGVTYISAAYDLGPAFYEATFRAVPDSVARSGTFGNLKLSQVPAALTAGGFHDFSTTGVPQLSFTVSPIGLADFSLGWDDPDPTKLSADYQFLVFDADGNYRADLGPIGADKPPIETLILDAPGPYQIAISLASPATSGTATRLRIIDDFVQDDHRATVDGLPVQPSAPSLFGHAAASTSIAVSSYRSDLTAPEPFNSLGPFTNVFDASGNRLATPEMRLKPDVAGVDGLDLTFAVFSSADYDHDGFPNAFGSSFSAATVAAVAALTIQAARGTATPAQVSSWLKRSASHSSTWAAADGYGYVNAVRATGLAASEGSRASTGCSTSASTGALWMFAAFAMLAAARESPAIALQSRNLKRTSNARFRGRWSRHHRSSLGYRRYAHCSPCWYGCGTMTDPSRPTEVLTQTLGIDRQPHSAPDAADTISTLRPHVPEGPHVA
jgi:hypothetical protein